MLNLMAVYECFACLDVCALYAYSAPGGQKRALDSLELKLQIVGPGNRMSALEEQPVAPNCWAVSQARRYFFLRPDIHNAINNLKE